MTPERIIELGDICADGWQTLGPGDLVEYLDETLDALEAANAEIARLREALKDIAYNTSMSIPPAMGGGDAVESSFYRTQTSRCIGIAARTLGEKGTG